MIIKFIFKKPPIDSSSEQGDKNVSIVGNIDFNDVSFNYPARPEIKILKNLSMKIKAGSTVALVGASGCGKSTCIQLIQRFYDPQSGSITIDNKNLKDFNLNWIRSQMGIVSQEPILFGTTIYENIQFGRDDATKEEIIQAAKNANAHDFIMNLPDVCLFFFLMLFV